MKIRCDKCNKILKKQGALIFSPPLEYESEVPTNEILKFHLCRHCYSSLCDWLEQSGGVNE